MRPFLKPPSKQYSPASPSGPSHFFNKPAEAKYVISSKGTYVVPVIIHLPLSTFPPVILTTLPPISVNSPPYVWHFYPL